jgi:cytochrome P450
LDRYVFRSAGGACWHDGVMTTDPWTGTRDPMELRTVSGLTNLSVTTADADLSRAYDQLRDRFGVIAPVELEPGVPAWLVMGYREISEIMRNEALYSRHGSNWRWHQDGLLAPDSRLHAFTPKTPRLSSFGQDGDLRERLRRPLDDGLARIGEAGLTAQVERVCHRLIDTLGQEGEADLVSSYTSLVGFASIASMLGFTARDSQALLDDARIIWSVSDQTPAAVQRVGALLGAYITQRHEQPREDLLSWLVHHQDLHTPQEMTDTVFALLIAGHEWIVAWTTQTLLLLLDNRQVATRLRRGRMLLDDALDEVAWREPPMSNTPGLRFATQDVLRDDVLIRKGDALCMAIGAANSDPALHTGDPWDEVGNRSYLTWGAGPHRCPASRQARIITRVAVEVVLRNLDLQLTTPAHELAWSGSVWMRYKKTIPVRFRRHK